jgi:hypothetical protein
MKATKFKSKLTTADEVRKEFMAILFDRITKRVDREMPKGVGIYKRMVFEQSEYGRKVIAAEKLNLIKEWEQKGRNMAFLSNDPSFHFLNLLSEKHTGKSLQ